MTTEEEMLRDMFAPYETVRLENAVMYMSSLSSTYADAGWDNEPWLRHARAELDRRNRMAG